MSYSKTSAMKLWYFLPLIYFFSCTPRNTFIDEYVTIIGKRIPATYTLKSGNECSMFISNNKDLSETFIKCIVNDNDVVQSCYITLSFSDFVYTNTYYKQLRICLKKANWQFVENISKYKKPKGEIYSKNGIYLGIYEPTYTLPVELSNSKENIYRDNFYEN